MTYIDTVVIGGGYWGSAISLEGEALGRNILLIDSNDPKSGSRNASAICDPAAYKSSVFKRYWPKEWSKSDLTNSLDWLLKKRAYKVKEKFWNKFAGTPPRDGADCIYLKTPSQLTDQVSSTKVNDEVLTGSIDTKRIDLSLRESGKVRCKKLVIAAGYKTDEVLGRLGLPLMGIKALYGRGLNVIGTPNMVLPISVMIKPYQKHTVRYWGEGRYKVGDTAEETPNTKKLQGLVEVGNSVLLAMFIRETTEGYRPVLDRFTVEKVTANVVVATGAQRVGLGLSGLVAKKVWEAFR